MYLFEIFNCSKNANFFQKYQFHPKTTFGLKPNVKQKKFNLLLPLRYRLNTSLTHQCVTPKNLINCCRRYLTKKTASGSRKFVGYQITVIQKISKSFSLQYVTIWPHRQINFTFFIVSRHWPSKTRNSLQTEEKKTIHLVIGYFSIQIMGREHVISHNSLNNHYSNYDT